ncbi:MAG: acyl carrier protein [Sulfuricella sp.]|nr:acyl carrier protein [Sulfuricella sp.]
MNSLQTVQQLLVEEFGLTPAQVHAEAALEELGVDSLATIECMFLLEDKFKIRFPGGDAVVIKTVGDIAREVDSLLAQQANAPAATDKPGHS